MSVCPSVRSSFRLCCLRRQILCSECNTERGTVLATAVYMIRDEMALTADSPNLSWITWWFAFVYSVATGKKGEKLSTR